VQDCLPLQFPRALLRSFCTPFFLRLRSLVILPRHLLRRACRFLVPLLCCLPHHLIVRANVQPTRCRCSLPQKPSSRPPLSGSLCFLLSDFPTGRTYFCALLSCALPNCRIEDKILLALQAYERITDSPKHCR
jgi:hypothetical protein